MTDNRNVPPLREAEEAVLPPAYMQKTVIADQIAT